MPYYFQRYRRRRFPNRRRRYWNFSRRPRKALRYRYRRRLRVRRFFRNKYRKRKLQKITVKQWQPTSIRNCTITGHLPLILCGQHRIPHNFTLYAESIVPEKESGGGAWSFIQLTLRALWDEFTKYRNWWTKGNNGYPLVKYRYTKLTLYRSLDTDYIVQIIRCPPFSVTRESYLDTQPSRMLMNIHNILVPHLGRKNYRKNYITKKIFPPSLWQNKWYFQQDVCNTPFFVLKTAALSLDQMYQPNTSVSNNLTLTTLNTDFFQNPQWLYDGTEGYIPKKVRQGSQWKNVYLYTATHQTPESNIQNWDTFIRLANTKTMTEGTKIQHYTNNTDDPKYWGNPFHPTHVELNRYYYSFTKVHSKSETFDGSQLYYIFEKLRYNPLSDSGKGNKLYFKSTSLYKGTFDDIPDDSKIIIEEYPLWLMFWGFTDWIEKSKPINQIKQNYQLVVKSKFLNPNRQTYVLLDEYFTQMDLTHMQPTETDKSIWHPKYEFQTYTESDIAGSGPAAPKLNKSKSIECTCKYKVKLKWGGCPAPMESISNPCEQEKYPTPNSVYIGHEIQDPATSKEHFLYEWDEKRSLITPKAAKRLKTDSIFDTSFAEFGALNPDHQEEAQATSPTPSEEEEDETLLRQLHKLKRKRKLLRDRIRQLTK
nr:MAG: ORF1 [TTV-like mini virus]